LIRICDKFAFKAPFSRDIDGYLGRQNRLHPMS
jgi:hypothetical protein